MLNIANPRFSVITPNIVGQLVALGLNTVKDCKMQKCKCKGIDRGCVRETHIT